MSVTYANVTGHRRTDKVIVPKGDGYGARLPTNHQVQIDGEQRWLNVWAICYSNAASFYVNAKGQRLFVRDSAMEN